ncbi:MAG: SH3 domain-containing protein [Elainellaceae cyanobacterium]
MAVVKSGLAVVVLTAAINALPLAAIANVSGALQPRVEAAPGLLAQATPTPFCRGANRRLDVYAQPSVGSDSASRATIERDTEVFLVQQTSGDGFVIQDGFAQVVVPSANSIVGYVIARHLKGCSSQSGSQPEPNPQPGTQAQCATVVISFLNVRAASSILARNLGTIGQGQVVRILEEETDSRQGRRIWAQIPFEGATGWVAATGASGETRNLSERFPCP